MMYSWKADVSFEKDRWNVLVMFEPSSESSVDTFVRKRGERWEVLETIKAIRCAPACGRSENCRPYSAERAAPAFLLSPHASRLPATYKGVDETNTFQKITIQRRSLYGILRSSVSANICDERRKCCG